MNPLRALVDRFYATASWSRRKQLIAATVAVVGVGGVVGAVGAVTHDPESRNGTRSSTTAVATHPITSVSPRLTTPFTTATERTTAPTSTTTQTNPARTVTSPVSRGTTTTEDTRPTIVAPTVPVAASSLLSLIPVEREHRGGYDRDFFAVWSDLDNDGCNTRAEVLIEESLTYAQVDSFGCHVVAGDWLSSYDGVTAIDPSLLDIDHVVALKESWDSGAWSWDPERRIAFANDVSDPRTLVAVSAESNRAKGDADPSNWLPVDGDVCAFISDWIAIKARWSLSMDISEKGRIRNLLRGECLGTLTGPWPPAP